MARSRTPKFVRAGFDQGYNHQQDARSARGRPPRAFHGQFNHTPIEAHHELGDEDENLTRAWNQFQVDLDLREEHRQPNGFPSADSHESGHPSTSNLDEARNRFSHPISSRPHQDADFVNLFDAGWSRAPSLSYDRQLYQHYLSCPPPSSISPNRRTQQRRSSQKVYEDDCESAHHPLPPSPTHHAAERFARGRLDWSSAPIPPRDSSNTPIYHRHTGSLPDASTHELRGLTRRPRVQNPHRRVSRVQGDGSTRAVDLEAPQVTEMEYSVMSVRRPNPDGSGFNFGSRFVLPPTAARPTTIWRTDDGARRLGASPSSHMDPETERPQSGIKAREEAGSASINTHSIPKMEPHTSATPSLMSYMEEERSPLSPVSTPEAPPLDQHSLIREDLQQEGERPIAGCRTDPQISFREAAAVDDRKSLDLVHSTSPSLEVSHLQSHAVPANKGDGREQPGQQALFRELYHMLEPLARPGSDTLRSKMEIRRDGEPGERVIHPGYAFEEESSPDTPRGPRGPEQILHVDILLAQRVVRDAMQEEGEGVGLLDQSFTPSESECGEEAVDLNSNLSECGLDRKHSTRSVFDWGYA